ncbi:glycosyltransferase, partial [Sporolactobacillus vineae]
DYPVFNLLLYPFFINSYDYALAASEAAGRFLYREKKFKIINNGIDVQRYTFNMHKRVSMREKLNITDKFVLLHIGRFNDQKNHSFLIDVFSEVIKRNPNSILILIGVGPRSDQVKRKVLEENLNNNVLFLGEKHHVEDFLSAADVFVFPSKFEALGIVNIEAQCSGLKCVVSDQVPSQAKVTNNLVFLPIRYPDRWAKNILKFKNGYNRQGQMNEIIKSKFDIRDNAKYLKAFYLEALAKRNDLMSPEK